MKTLVYFIFFFIFYLWAAAENRSRIEELFIWKISEDLKLNTQEEKYFSEYIRDLNVRKTKLNEDIQSHIKKMGVAKSSKEKEILIKTYRKILNDYNQLQVEEIDKVSKLIGFEKANQYFVFKQDLSNRLKEMLTRPEVKSEIKDKKPKPLPKLIEE